MIDPPTLSPLSPEATEAEALIIITRNYSRAYKIRDQLIGLQEWIDGQVNATGN